MKTRLLLLILFCGYLGSCTEKERYEISASGAPPGIPTNVTWKSMPGGVRFYYTVPRDRDVLEVKAEYINERGKTLSFSTSFFSDSLDVIGFADTISYNVKLYATNRAGVRSEERTYPVKPLEAALNTVANTLVLKRSFNSFFVEWENVWEWDINVFVTMKFKQNGVSREVIKAFSSKLEKDRVYVEDLNDLDNNEIEVFVRVGDIYENSTKLFSYGKLALLKDERLDKVKMTLPQPNDSVGGIPQLYGNLVEGRNAYLIDDIIDEGNILNFIHTGGTGSTENIGRTGVRGQGNNWNVLIYLGGWYQLSRCLTHQRFQGDNNDLIGIYFGGPIRANTWNVGHYAMWVLNEDVNPPVWERCSNRMVWVPPTAMPLLEQLAIGRAGDMALFYPEEPQFTRPVRWFRYEKLGSFQQPDNPQEGANLSEITLFGSFVKPDNEGYHLIN
ncbi:MAG: DUF4959 domain-containing protein [Bacteroidales bacterium]|jgi:hypothetical protein|nr:DUF4959 domain-containing protein [Bacteroidales bacterium]